MKIEKNKMVSLIYQLRENNYDGRVIESLTTANPLTFLFGAGRLLPEFEARIAEMGKDDEFKFTLSPDEAYGERREDMVINIPLNIFEKNGKIDEEVCSIGNEVPMVDSEGNQISGKVCEIGDSYVKMDFNHPMAGLNLFFTGKIIDVRPATEQEITGTNHPCTSCGSKGTEADCEGSCCN
jgi:FKBP-type peptidyl-prolyl cis-trans isomerase SlyD